MFPVGTLERELISLLEIVIGEEPPVIVLLKPAGHRVESDRGKRRRGDDLLS
jgi:hypothetical protein